MKLIYTILLACLLTWPAWAAGTVNINTASAEEIAESLNGIGLSKAQEIVRYRDEHGAFTDLDELVNVKASASARWTRIATISCCRIPQHRRRNSPGCAMGLTGRSRRPVIFRDPEPVAGV